MISTSTHLAQLFSHKNTDFPTTPLKFTPTAPPTPSSHVTTNSHKKPRYQLATTLNSVSGGSKTFNGMAFITVVRNVRRLSGGGGGWLKGMVVKRFADFTMRFMNAQFLFGCKSIESIHVLFVGTTYAKYTPCTLRKIAAIFWLKSKVGLEVLNL